MPGFDRRFIGRAPGTLEPIGSSAHMCLVLGRIERHAFQVIRSNLCSYVAGRASCTK